MKRMFSVILAVLVLGLPFAGCTGTETKPEESESPSSESVTPKKTFQDWDEEISFNLYTSALGEVDVTVKCTFDGDGEKARSAAAAYLDPDEVEAGFEGKSMRWIRADMTVTLAEDVEEDITRVDLGPCLGLYPDQIFCCAIAGGQESNAAMNSESFSVAIIVKPDESLRSCRATIFAYVPDEDDSYVVGLQKLIKGSHDTPEPASPKAETLFWKLKDAE